MAKFYKEKSFITSDNSKINYIDEGLTSTSTSTFIFLHDFNRRGMSFNRLGQELVHLNRVIWFDYRGHGKAKSDGPYTIKTLAQDLNDLITYLQLTNITIIAYGLGGLVFFEYINNFDISKIKSAILIDTSPKLMNNKDWSYGMYQGNYRTDNLEADIKSIISQPTKFLSYYYSQAMPEHTADEPRDYEPSLLFKILALLSLNKTALNYWEEMMLCDYRDTLRKINFPVKIIYANPGSLFTEHGALYLNSVISHSKLYSIYNSTHNSILMKTSELLNIIQDDI